MTFNFIVQDITPVLKFYLPESKRFLYSGRYAKRKKRIKYSYCVTAFDRNLVSNDYITTMFNGIKTFSEVNTTIMKYRRKKALDLSLTAVGRLKRVILFRTTEMIYLTHRFLSFRNLILKMTKNQYQFLTFNTYARPLNKLLFFSLSNKLSAFKINAPCFIMYHHRKLLRLRIYYLGFRLIIKKKLFGSLLKGTLLDKSRHKRTKKIVSLHTNPYTHKLLSK